MRTLGMICVAGFSLVATSAALAHHSFAMFDFTHRLTFEGTVEQFEWANPHGHIVVLVPPTAKDPATVGRWDIEGQATNIMRRQGWNAKTLKAGDKVTIVGYPMHNGTKAASLYYAVVGGKEMYGDPNRRGGVGTLGTGAPPSADDKK
jgi:hypothetical protein